MKKRILYIINSLKNGGPVNMLYTLSKYIDKEKFEVMILALKQCDPNNEIDFENINCLVKKLNSKNIRESIYGAQKVVNEWKPDIIHSHGGIADIVSTKLKGGHNSFSTVHCDPDEDFVMKKGKLRGKIKTAVFFHTLKDIDKPIACSETVAKKIKEKRNLDLEFVRNGLDLDKYNVAEKIERSDLGFDKDDIVLLFCGYLSKRKNVSFLVKTFSMVTRKDIRLLIVGDGNEYEQISKLAANDKRIVMVGRSDCPVKYMKIADFLISASLSEGLPLSVMEGLGCGLPALLSNIEAHQEIKGCCEAAVQIFELDDYIGLKNLLETIQINKLEKEHAKIAVYSYLNAERMAVEYQKKYDEML